MYRSLQLHCPPSDVCSKKETFEMMDDIVKKGKILHYGVSVEKYQSYGCYSISKCKKHPNNL